MRDRQHFHLRPSSADFITITAESDFRYRQDQVGRSVHTCRRRNVGAPALTLGLMRTDKVLNSRCWTRSTIYQDRDGAVGQHFDCFATQDNCRDPAPPVGGHHNQIARFCLRRIDNSLERMLVLDMDCIATYTGSRRGGPALRDSSAAWLRWVLGSITPPISPRLPA